MFATSSGPSLSPESSSCSVWPYYSSRYIVHVESAYILDAESKLYPYLWHIVQLMLLVSVFASDQSDTTESGCTVIAIVLHFTVILQFVWILAVVS